VINERVRAMAAEAGFQAVWALRDRVVHRGIALEGRTAFDTPENGKLTMSELAGRSEVRALLALINGTQAAPEAQAA
jgi:hypothetical protein